MISDHVCIQCSATYRVANARSRFCSKKCRMDHKVKFRLERQSNLQARSRKFDRDAECLDLNESARFDPRGYFVYLLWGRSRKTPIYVGQSTNVFGRISSHLYSPDGKSDVCEVQLIRCSSKLDMCELELALIRKYKPALNVVGIEDVNDYDLNVVGN